MKQYLKEFPERLKGYTKGKNPIVAKFRCDTSINRASYLSLMKSVHKAEQSKRKIEAVAFVVNSPGGSPAYSSLMGDRVREFAKIRKVPFYTFAEDYAASGGYWLLCMGK